MVEVFSIGKNAFDDINKLQKALNKQKKIFPTKWDKALFDAADIARKFFERNFGTRGAEFGNKWKSLAKSTQKDRKRKGFKATRPILVRRGRLSASVVDKRSAGHVQTISRTGIMLQSRATVNGRNLFTIHQKGTKRIPARKMVKEGTPPFISKRGWEEIRCAF